MKKLISNWMESAKFTRDEKPNINLAETICSTSDIESVSELVELLNHSDSAVQADAVKVLYEIGERNPSMIAGYLPQFIALLNHKNNRMIWGSMCAIDAAVSANPKAVYKNLSVIMETAEKGSVITKDHAVSILVKLCESPKFYPDCIELLLELTITAPENQFPSYCEKSSLVVKHEHILRLNTIISDRISTIDQESRLKRLNKVLKNLNKKSI